MREPFTDALAEAADAFVERLRMKGIALVPAGRTTVDADWLAGVFLILDEVLLLEPDAARSRATILERLVAKLSEGRS